MKGFDVLKVKSAVKSRNKFDLSHSHLTTMDFGEIVPLLAEEVVPGDEFSVSGEYFSRMAPLVKPTYGKFKFKTVSGFVPYYQIADDAEAWLAGKTTFEGQTPKHRYFTMLDLHEFIHSWCRDFTATGTAVNADYIFIDTDGSTYVYDVFSPEGKKMIKILNALGYALPQGVNLNTSSSWYVNMRQVKLSAYPLLAFCKLYNDYMSQSQRYNTSALSDYLYKIRHGINITNYYVSGSGNLTGACIQALLGNIRLNYENDYFTSAWQSPNAPLNGTESITSVTVPAAGSAYAVTNSVQNSSVTLNTTVSGSTTSGTLSQRALDFLKSFDDWVRRNNYSGSRVVQQVYSRFGIKTQDYRSNYAEVINTDQMPIQVGDVTATADATGVPLGDYAGKGIMNGNGGFSFKTSDYGLLMILGYFTVVPMNSYGFDRKVLRNAPLDYYNPEFDGLGADAISIGEVYASPIAVINDATIDSTVFGYTERYNSYRYGRDQITGEFRDYRSNGDMNTWHTGRNLSNVRRQGFLVAQNSAVNTLEMTNSQYNRIFSITNSIVNHFYLTCQFKVSAIRPMLNLNQVVNLGTGDTTVPRNGNVIS